MPDVKLVSLGCDKNRVDGEVLLGLLQEAGYTPAPPDAEAADVIIVNTCGFIRDAVQESIDTVLALAAHKETGACKALLVVGCMAERYKDEIKTEIPEVDAVAGVGDPRAIVSAALALTGGNASVVKPSCEFDEESLYLRRASADGLAHVAYVKIAEGCDNRCAYCTIPSIRGAYRIRPFDSIVEECKNLIAHGARELTLVAQDTARYPRLHELLGAIASINSHVWVRLMYAYPEHITPELVTALGSHPNLCRYLDMPIQHSHDAVLKRMGRHSTEAGLRKVINELREKVPGIALRTTLMVGFPGETDEEFQALYDFVRDIRFDRLGVFAYSREDGTPAARMKPQIKSAVKNARRDALMRLQQDIHREKQHALRGQEITVMTDVLVETDAAGIITYTGRSYRDAYEVDSAVLFTTHTRLSPGDVARVRVDYSDEYDLQGKCL